MGHISFGRSVSVSPNNMSNGLEEETETYPLGFHPSVPLKQPFRKGSTAKNQSTFLALLDLCA